MPRLLSMVWWIWSVATWFLGGRVSTCGHDMQGSGLLHVVLYISEYHGRLELFTSL